MAGKRWRLARDVLKPFNIENVLIIGITAPPAGTLSRMVICGGGKASIVENMSFLCEDDMCSMGMGKNFPSTTGKNTANYPGDDNLLNDRTLIIAASNNKYNEDLLLKLDSLLKERGISALLKSPSFLLDALCGACMTPAYAAASALINTTTTTTTSSVAEPIKQITPFYKIENVLLHAPSVAPSASQPPAQSKKRKYLHTDIPIL